MAISLVGASSVANYVASDTSISITLPTLQADDLILIGVFGRSTLTGPLGYTASTQTPLHTGDQREVVYYKTAVAGDSGATVTVNQASADRMGITYAVYRSTLGAFTFADDAVSTGTTLPITANTVTAASNYVAFGIAGNTYADTNVNVAEPKFGTNTDAAWTQHNTTGAGTNTNRLGYGGAILSSGTSPRLDWTMENTISASWGLVTVAFTEGAEGDTTAPALTSPTATATGDTTADGSVSTDEGDATLYWIASTSSTKPSEVQIQAGQDNTGSAAADSGNQYVASAGVQNVSVTGLTAETPYYLHFQCADAAGNNSTVVTSSSFTTDAATVAAKGIRVNLNDGATDQANLTGITAIWWDSNPRPTASPVFHTDAATTDANGDLILNLDASTALNIGDSGFLLVWKPDATITSSLGALAVIQIEDVS